MLNWPIWLRKLVGLLRLNRTVLSGIRVAKFSEIVLIFDSPELESLNYHQFQDVVEIYAIAHSQIDDADWNAVQLFAKMILQIDRAMVEAWWTRYL